MLSGMTKYGPCNTCGGVIKPCRCTIMAERDALAEQAGEWYRTGLMTKEVAEKVAESFRESHEQVEVYYDDDGK